MIDPGLFYKILKKGDIDFFIGVPDSLLKGFNNYLASNLRDDEHIIAANEGGAVSIAAGYYLATGKIPLVYMQNSGLGNSVNPLTSLVHRDVYSIPVLLLVGWRGEPGVKDELQHVVQGKITLKLLETMQIPFRILSSDPAGMKKDISWAVGNIKSKQSPHALVVRKNTFSDYVLSVKPRPDESILARESVIGEIISNLGENYAIVSTTGKTSRELFEYRELTRGAHDRDFLVVGSMGHASQIALGLALNKPDRKIVCFDGDGALIMHMGALSIIGRYKPNNFLHIILNNGSHESVGGQPTSASSTDFCKVALACGYKKAVTAKKAVDIKRAIKGFKNNGPIMIEVKIKTQSRKDLGRPTISLQSLKNNFIQNLRKNKSR